MNNFEDAAAFIIPTDPVAKRKQARKRSEVDVLSAKKEKQKEKNKRAKTGEEVDISSTTVPSQRVGKGTTGVEFRYYKEKEYKELNKDQRQELHEWRQRNNMGKVTPKSDGSNLDRRTIATMISDQIKSALSSMTSTNKDEKTVKIGSTTIATSDKPVPTNVLSKSKQTSSILKGVLRKIR